MTRSPDAQRTVEAVWRIESPRLIAGLARMTRDVAAAEDLAQDALVAALETWPRSGVPDNPGAWLMATAKNRAIDAMRRRARLEEREHELAHEQSMLMSMDSAAPDEGGELLDLMVTCCHPVVPRDARVALTLRLLGGLSTSEIARAFLVPETTVSQRITRAKRALAGEGVDFGVGSGEELPARLGSVLEVLYLIFNEGYAASAGDDLIRTDLLEDAMRLGRVLAAAAPREPEVHGLLALMELQASRARARVDRHGLPVLLEDQDRSRWDLLLIGRGLKALDRARELGGAAGPYALQAAIAACHARARRPEDTDWGQIAALYAALERVAPTPVVTLNRAVAVGRAEGPDAGLAVLDALDAQGALVGYHLLPAVRGDLLEQSGRGAEAREAFAAAAALTDNARERELLERRARAAG